MNLNIIKNPLVLGIISALLAYVYLYWSNNRANKKSRVSLKTPLIVGVSVFIITCIIFYNASDATQNLEYKVQDNYLSDSFGCNNKYHVINKRHIIMPPNDIFIDIAKF